MAERLYILCPGQGAQEVGMGQAHYEASGAAREVFDEAEQVLGIGLKELCFKGPADRLNQTDISQPAIYVTSVACYRWGVEAGRIEQSEVAGYAGLSLGEYTGLHLAGAMDFADGLKLVAARGRYMQEAAEATPSGMVSILGATESEVQRLCDNSANGEVLVAANFNAPGQIVVSGSAGACERIASAAEAAGYRAVPLKVAGGFHSALMEPAAEKMAAELNRVEINCPEVTVYANVTARPHENSAGIRRRLIEQIVSPVRWEQTMRHLLEDGSARFVELGPGRVLTGLMKKVGRRIPVENLAMAP